MRNVMMWTLGLLLLAVMLGTGTGPPEDAPCAQTEVLESAATLEADARLQVVAGVQVAACPVAEPEASPHRAEPTPALLLSGLDSGEALPLGSGGTVLVGFDDVMDRYPLLEPHTRTIRGHLARSGTSAAPGGVLCRGVT